MKITVLKTNVTHIEVFQGANKEWYWRAKAGNHEIVATSEGYFDKFNALRAVQNTWPKGIPVYVIDVPEEADENPDVSGKPEQANGEVASEGEPAQNREEVNQ
jgi:uncharacterized protein YegP (UPF0339 family)